MIVAIMNTMIGPLGRAILGFYFANQTVINSIFVVWAVLITYASMQLNKVRLMTVTKAVDILKKNSEWSDEELWNSFRPVWQEELTQLKVNFILNRWNIWITKPTPENLIEVMRLSPEWFATLRKVAILPYRFLFGSRNVKVRSIQRDH